MPTTRYFAATDGTKTYFRASPTRTYRSMSVDQGWRGWSFHQYDHAPFPVHEITGKEFRALMRLKQARDPKATAPRDSWVYNRDLPEAEGEPEYLDPQPNDGPARLAMLFPGLGNRRIVLK